MERIDWKQSGSCISNEEGDNEKRSNRGQTCLLQTKHSKYTVPSAFTLVGVLAPVPLEPLIALTSGVGCLEDDARGADRVDGPAR